MTKQSLGVGRLYINRKEERELADIEECVDAAIQKLEEYTKNVKRKTNYNWYKNSHNKNNTKTKRKTWIIKLRKQKMGKKINCKNNLEEKLREFYTR